MLGADPKITTLPGGATVASFSIALNDVYTDANGDRKERTTWVHCNCWGAMANVCRQYLKKGNRVHVTGRLRQRSYTNNDGVTIQQHEIFVTDLLLLDKTPGEGTFSYFNQCNFIGHVGRDPETRDIAPGLTVTKFPISLHEDRPTPAGGTECTTTWLIIECWKHLALSAHLGFKKGDRVHISGKINSNVWVDANKNIQYKHLVCNAAEVQLLNPYEPLKTMPTEQVHTPAPQAQLNNVISSAINPTPPEEVPF